MGHWAAAAVANAIQNESHNAHAEGRVPTLAYNPFTILITKKKSRDHKQLEREYKAKWVRNPLTFSESVGPFLEAAWEYRKENPRAADFLIIDLLWGLRGDECRSPSNGAPKFPTTRLTWSAGSIWTRRWFSSMTRRTGVTTNFQSGRSP